MLGILTMSQQQGRRCVMQKQTGALYRCEHAWDVRRTRGFCALPAKQSACACAERGGVAGGGHGGRLQVGAHALRAAAQRERRRAHPLSRRLRPAQQQRRRAGKALSDPLPRPAEQWECACGHSTVLAEQREAGADA